ncbi:flagellar hook-length control protein FliK [Desulforapulum autotrophicum]|nr:flagellar hook-length control protein FliK [Desulforapulum autotrophicum]
MILNFVNTSTFSGDTIPLAMGIDAGTGVEGLGTGASFADRLMAVLSPETARAGKVSGKDIEDTIDEKNGKNMVLPISGLPFLSSILAAMQVPEQVSTRLINDAKQDGVGIDLDQLIKGLQTLQKESFLSGVGFGVDSQSGVEQMFKSLGLEIDESDPTALTLGDFVAALEKLRTSSEMVATAETDAQQETGPEGDALTSILTSLQIPGQDANSLTLDDFVAALEKLGISPGSTSQADADEEAGMKINLDLSAREVQGNKINPGNTDVLLVRNLVAALEKMGDSSESDPSGLSSAGFTGKSDVESILGSLINSLSRNNGQSMEMEGRFNQAESSSGEVSSNSPMDLFGVKVDPKSQTPTLPEIQAGFGPEFSRSMENLAAVVKEMKSSIDDTRMMEQGVMDRNMVKEPGRNVTAIDSSGGAGGEFRQMGMDSRGQSVADAGTPRSFLPAHVTSQVGKSLARAVSQGETELKLQLKPPELGRIIMTIDNIGTSLKVSVVTESHVAKEILAAHVNELKATLANSGISIGSFDVEMGSDFSQSMADARHQSKGSGSRRGRNRGAGIEEIGSDPKIDVRGFAGDAHSLHFVA